MNKVPNSIWIKPYNRSSKLEVKETELKSRQITIVNYNKLNKYYCLKEENSINLTS
jgi:hypothetical protein